MMGTPTRRGRGRPTSPGLSEAVGEQGRPVPVRPARARTVARAGLTEPASQGRVPSGRRRGAPVEQPTVGIDVSKAALDVAVWPSGETWRVAYDPEGVEALVRRIVGLQPHRVVVEATG